MYLLSVNEVNVTDICLGLHTLAKNTAKQRAGAINVSDGEYSDSDYGLRLEVQNSNEVSIFDQKVVQQDLNKELMHPEGTLLVEPWDLEFSSPYPQKVEVEIGLDGLVGKDSEGKETFGSVGIKLEYSTDGGQTYKDFGTFACTGLNAGESVTHSESTHETTITMKDYHSMRLVATKTFSTQAEILEVTTAVNNVLEIRIQRSTIHYEENYIYDTVTLKAIRTYCYDPDTSTSSTLVKQPPLVLKDRQRTTRLGFQITSTDKNGLQDLQQFNCTLQALGRTCTESGGAFTWSQQESETCNPASMALKVLQSNALGSYKYADDEIDLQSFGELYKFCDEYDIDDIGGNHVGICCNGIISSQKKLSDHLNDILSVGRAIRIYNGNKIGVFVDKPIATTTLILNNQNVLSATNHKNFDELPSGIKAGFVNEDNYAQKDSMYIDYADAPARSSIDYVTISKDFVYQTNVEQIQKNGFYELAKLKLRPETWNRKVTSEGALAFIGAKIEIQDDTVAIGIGDGAEIIGFVYDDEDDPRYITKIITDGHFEVTDTSETYGVKIQHASADSVFGGISYIKKQVNISQGGIYSEFTLTDPISLNETCPSLGDILSFGIFSKITFETICFGKQDNGDGTYDLTVVPYDEGIYTADQGEIPEFHSKVTVPSYYRVVGNTKIANKDEVRNGLTELQTLVEEGNPNDPPSPPTGLSASAYKDYITITWQSSGTELKDTVRRYLVYLCKNWSGQGEGATWELVGYSDSNTFYYYYTGSDCYKEASYFSTWRVKIIAENIYGVSSETTATEQISTSSYKTWIPSIPTSAVAVWEKDFVTLTWNCDESVTYGNYQYEVSFKKGDSYKVRVVTDKYYVYYFDRENGEYPERGTYYRLSLRVSNESGNYSYATVSSNWTKYLTWFPKTPLIQFSNTSGRTASFEVRQDDTYWGWERYEVQISKDEQNWYGVNTDADPKLSEDNWKTTLNAVKQFYSNQFNQSLPLEGQSTVTGAVVTNYYYRVRSVTKVKDWDSTEEEYVDTYRYSSWSEPFMLVARPTQAVDIVNNAINNAKLQDNAVSTDKIIDGAITVDKIRANTITADKLNAVAVNKINSFTGSDTTVGDTTAQGWTFNSSGVEIVTSEE